MLRKSCSTNWNHSAHTQSQTTHSLSAVGTTSPNIGRWSHKCTGLSLILCCLRVSSLWLLEEPPRHDVSPKEPLPRHGDRWMCRDSGQRTLAIHMSWRTVCGHLHNPPGGARLTAEPTSDLWRTWLGVTRREEWSTRQHKIKNEAALRRWWVECSLN